MRHSKAHEATENNFIAAHNRDSICDDVDKLW